MSVRAYSELLRRLDELETEVGRLPEISSYATQHFPLAIIRPLCMMKALTKMAISAEAEGILSEWKYRMEKAHVEEEIDMLEDDLRYLGDNLKRLSTQLGEYRRELEEYMKRFKE